jgi:hypothetical protein
MSKPEDAAPKQNEAAKKGLAVSRAEVILVVLFVMAGAFGSFLIDRAVGLLGRRFEPRESLTRLSHNVQWKQDALLMTRKEQTATEDQLIKARLEFYSLEAALDATPATATATRAEVSLKREAAAHSTDRLIHRLDELQKEANSLRREVEEGEQLTARDFGFQHVVYKAVRAVSVFVLTLLLLLVIYLLVLLLSKRLTRNAAAKQVGAHAGDSGFMLKAVAGVLFVLAAYQAFEVAGAALAAAVILLLFLNSQRRAAPEAAGGGTT